MNILIGTRKNKHTPFPFMAKMTQEQAVDYGNNLEKELDIEIKVKNDKWPTASYWLFSAYVNTNSNEYRMLTAIGWSAL